MRETVTAPAPVDALVELRGVTKSFKRPRGGNGVVLAVDDVSLSIPAGVTYGLIGESGSGKSTLARCLLRLYPVDTGTISLDGADITRASGRRLRRARRRMQLVFQDPYLALDPRLTIEGSVAEPARELAGLRGPALHGAVREALDAVELSPALLRRYPSELSGGQCQRVGIARALAARPSLLVLDEPTSALDVSVQAQILNLLNRLQRELRLTYVLITHDLDVVRYMADTIGVMYRGRLIETGRPGDVFSHPEDPYTRTLVASSRQNRLEGDNDGNH